MDIRAAQRARVSVVLSACDGEETITRALESVLGRAFDRVQLVVVVMPSQDRTLSICERAAERNIRLDVITSDDASEAAAFDRGLAVSRGDYVLFMRQSDWLAPRALELMLEAAESHDLDFVLPARRLDDASRRMGGIIAPAGVYLSHDAFRAHAAEFVEGGAFDGVTGKLLRRSRIEELGLRANLKTSETDYLAAYLMGADSAASVPAAVFHAGDSATSLSSSDCEPFDRFVHAYERLNELARQWGEGEGDAFCSAVARQYLRRVVWCIEDACARRSVSSIERSARVRDMLEAPSTRSAVAVAGADPAARRELGLMLGPIARGNVLVCCISARVSAMIEASQDLRPRREPSVA